MPSSARIFSNVRADEGIRAPMTCLNAYEARPYRHSEVSNGARTKAGR